MKRLHIVGCPRSGTTLLMELVSTCFENSGHCPHEISVFSPLPVEAGPYFTKQPNDIKQLQHIFGRDTDLHVIYMGRDPRAVITSKHRENPEQYFCNYRVWSECDRAAAQFRGQPRFLELRYEDLIARADEVQQHICQQFGFLQLKYRFSEYHLHSEPSQASQRAMNGLRAINTDSLIKWRQHLPRIAEQLQRHPGLADDLVRLGYEKDQDWQQPLGDVAPQVFPCRYPERRPCLKEWEKSLRVWLKSRRYLKALQPSGE